MATVDRFRDLLSYDKESGLLIWKAARGPRKAGAVAGKITAEGYVSIGIDGKTYQGHRIAWAIATGALPTGVIDHVNGVRDDNRLCNLRDTTLAVNNANKHRASRRNRSGLLGASWDPNNKNWRSEICVNGVRRNIGRFPTAEAANAAYLAERGKASR